MLSAAEKDYGQTPLHCAVHALHEEVVRILLKRMASASLSIDPRDKKGHTPLQYAACWGYNEVRSFQGSPKWRKGGTSCGASSGASARAVKVLKKASTPATKDGDEDKDRCYDRLVRLLVESGANVEAVGPNGYSTLHLAVFAEQESAIRLLLELGKCNPSPRDRIGWTPLMWAVDKSWITIARLLLNFEADVSATDKDGQTALHLAAMEQNVDMIRLLLQFGADACAVDKEGGTPLYVSCQHGPLEAARLLIEKASDLNLPFYKTMDTPLLIAINCQPLAAELLIEAGCDPKLANKDGVTPLHRAAYFRADRQGQLHPLQIAIFRSSLVAELLIDWGSDLHVLDNRGDTPLHIAANKGPPETVQMLLEKGLDPAAKDDHDATPLHAAALLGSVAVATLLIEGGTDAKAVCEEYGGTALDIVRKRIEKEEEKQKQRGWMGDELKGWLEKNRRLVKYLESVTAD